MQNTIADRLKVGRPACLRMSRFQSSILFALLSVGSTAASMLTFTNEAPAKPLANASPVGTFLRNVRGRLGEPLSILDLQFALWQKPGGSFL